MTKFKSICCPKQSDHKYPKNLLFVRNDELYVFCKDHMWIKVVFSRGEEKFSFDNFAVTLNSNGENLQFDHEPMPVLALGAFNLRRKIKEKRNGKYK